MTDKWPNLGHVLDAALSFDLAHPPCGLNMSQKRIRYLLSAGHPGFQSYYTPAVAYHPGQAVVEINDGFGAHATGAAFSYSEALAKRKWIEERNAGWFIPFLERLAKGQDVPIREIQKAYFELFGKDLPSQVYQ